MSLRDLKLAEMVPITRRWIGPQRQLFASILEMAPLLPVIEAAHIRAAQCLEDSVTEARIATLTGALAEADATHDDLVRVVNGAIEAVNAWAEQGMGRAELEGKGAWRFVPRGLSDPLPFPVVVQRASETHMNRSVGHEQFSSSL